MEKLTIQEEEVMIYIWELQCCFVKDIVAKYTQPAPPYTTVASIVKNLERKGYVTPKRVGNMVSFFAKDRKISADDLKDIIELIEKGKEN